MFHNEACCDGKRETICVESEPLLCVESETLFLSPGIYLDGVEPPKEGEDEENNKGVGYFKRVYSKRILNCKKSSKPY